MLVLGIDTATDVCAVGLVRGATPLVDLSVRVPRSHGTRLAPLVTEALAHAGLAAPDLDAVAVSAGPGSYTGLRIGLSLAKGLCLAADAALVAVPTLDALARVVQRESGTRLVVPCLPSRRGEVYAAAYRPGVAGLATLRDAAPVALANVPDWLGEPDTAVALCGPAADAVRDSLPQAQTVIVPGVASGLVIARMGADRAEAGDTESVAAYEPDYLKPFVSGDGIARG